MRKVDNSRAACIHVYTGATGSGKSTRLQQDLKRAAPRRLLVWDYKGEYDHIHRADTLGRLLDMAATAKGRVRLRFAIRYCPSPRLTRQEMAKLFSVWCSVAMRLGDVAVVIEEAQMVTRPNGGPPAYREMITVGRGRDGVQMYVTSQRPATIDKDILANSTTVYTGRLGWPDDEAVMAKTLKVPVADVAALLGHDSIIRNRLTGELRRNC